MSQLSVQPSEPEYLGQLTKVPELIGNSSMLFVVTSNLTMRTYQFLDDGSIIILTLGRAPIRLVPPSGTDFAWDLRHFFQRIDSAESALIDTILRSSLKD